MNKFYIWSIIIYLSIGFVFTSCGGDEDEPEYNQPTISSFPAPTGVSAKIVSDGVKLSWNPVEDAEFYTVSRVSSKGTVSLGYIGNFGRVYDTQVVDCYPEEGDNYYYIQACKDLVGNRYTTSPKSSSAYVYYTKNNYPDGGNDYPSGGNDYPGGDNDNSGSGNTQQKPTAPTGLNAVQSGTSIVVSWNSVPNAYYYRLWYSTPSGQEDFTNVYAPTTSAVFDRNMKEGTYKFWIQTLNSDYEESNKSSKVSCTYKSNGGGNQGGDTSSKLETPQNIEASSSTYFVQISVDEVPLAYEYELYRSNSATYGYSKIPASGGSTASGRYVLTDNNPKSGTTYYKVKAKALSYLGIADSDFSSYVKVVR